MVLELEKPRITEIQVRMDCNGCVQKIKKALHGINGIYDIYIDFPQQKLTVVGWADPEKIIKAIKKTRKIATICSHTEVSEPEPQPSAPEGEKAAPEVKDPPPPENPQAEPAPTVEPPKDPPPALENLAPEAKPSPAATETASTEPIGPSEPSKDVEEIHIIHHDPTSYTYNEHWNTLSIDHGFQHEPSPHAIHSYNTYKPSAYVSEYANVRSPPRNFRYRATEHYADDYHSRRNADGNNITSMFSDENPNACTIA